MADPDLRRPENAPGDLFVDTTCIDCHTCRWMAPETFARVGPMSAVARQPASEDEHRRAALALVACPTASIGGATDLRRARDAFPVPLAAYFTGTADDPDAARVHHCGFHAEASFGAASLNDSRALSEIAAIRRPDKTSLPHRARRPDKVASARFGREASPGQRLATISDKARESSRLAGSSTARPRAAGTCSSTRRASRGRWCADSRSSAASRCWS